MSRRFGGTGLGLLIFWGIAFVLAFLNLSGYLMNDDEGTYLYAAWRTGLGEVPYRDFSLVQAPLDIYLGAGVFRLFGASVLPARAISVLFMLGSAALIYLSARRHLKLKTGFALASAGIFFFNKHVFFLGRSFMPDVPMIFFGAASLYFALQAESADPAGRRGPKAAAISGLMAGLSALAKLNGGLVAAGYAAFLLIQAARRRQPWKTAAAKAAFFAGGFAISFGIPLVLFLAFVPGTFDSLIGFHAAKESAAGVTYAALLLRRLVQLAGNHNYALAAGALAALFAGRASEGREKSARSLLWTIAAASLILLFLPSRFFIRYAVFAAVPLALLFGAGLETLFRRKAAGRIALPVLAVLTLLCLGPTLSPKKILARDEGTRAAAAFIRENTGPEDYVFGDDPFLNFLARRPCPPRLVDVSEAMVTAGRITSADIIADCERLPVKLVFVESGAAAHHLAKLADLARLRGYLLDRYRPAAAVQREFLNVEFFLRNK